VTMPVVRTDSVGVFIVTGSDRWRPVQGATTAWIAGEYARRRRAPEGGVSVFLVGERVSASSNWGEGTIRVWRPRESKKFELWFRHPTPES
jgi:hypothetical protein